MSEVEALCDRVGILRRGRLVEQGTLAELRRLSAQTIEVTFEGAAPQLPSLAGTQVALVGPKALRLQVFGPMQPVLSALSRYRVATLTSREPSLEEIFLHHYNSVGGHDT